MEKSKPKKKLTEKTNSRLVSVNDLKLKVKLGLLRKNQNRQRLTLIVSLLDSNNNVICEDSDFVSIE